ncbi:putative MAPEG superfamily protein [Chitinivorax tropicus]|uniref:Putative MAPEG superfamily protein n=1 Tax=Chitinivorax tropicus TaxID=714531 RepID=A0A840MC43_9PROT|nr:putative MAPEG superfamily protein [Chitinivorax tropicus]
MTAAYWCVMISALMPIIWVALAKAQPGYNNRAPRPYLDKLEGWRKRASWAQQNSWEALAMFAPAVLLAQQAHAPQDRIDTLAIAFVLIRLVYGLCYLADQQALRSLVWFAGIGCTIGIYLAPL